MNILNDIKTGAVAAIIKDQHSGIIGNILVVGCGSGIEAAVLSKKLNANVTGIDVVNKFNKEASEVVKLEVGDALALNYDDATFDFIYSYHALEHIKDPIKALKEMNRVLKNGGGYWIGTPNRHRLIGYVGSKGVSIRDKLKWNLQDWKARVTCKFKNELGAHAGFSKMELRKMLLTIFSSAEDLSGIYFRSVYKNKQQLIKLISLSGLSGLVFPSVYFYGKKR